MPDDLYQRDFLSWSEQQAELLRRTALGERVNGVDWPHIVEEIADLGLSELNSVRSLLRQGMIHLLKMYLSPDDQAGIHWFTETDAFLADAATRFAPSMRQRIDVQDIYARTARSLRRVRDAFGASRAIPATCPWSLDQLLEGDPDTLLAVLRLAEETTARKAAAEG